MIPTNSPSSNEQVSYHSITNRPTDIVVSLAKVIVEKLHGIIPDTTDYSKKKISSKKVFQSSKLLEPQSSKTNLFSTLKNNRITKLVQSTVPANFSNSVKNLLKVTKKIFWCSYSETTYTNHQKKIKKIRNFWTKHFLHIENIYSPHQINFDMDEFCRKLNAYTQLNRDLNRSANKRRLILLIGVIVTITAKIFHRSIVLVCGIIFSIVFSLYMIKKYLVDREKIEVKKRHIQNNSQEIHCLIRNITDHIKSEKK